MLSDGTVRQNLVEESNWFTWPRQMIKPSSFHYFKTLPEIIRLAVIWLKVSTGQFGSAGEPPLSRQILYFLGAFLYFFMFVRNSASEKYSKSVTYIDINLSLGRFQGRPPLL